MRTVQYEGAYGAFRRDSNHPISTWQGNRHSSVLAHLNTETEMGRNGEWETRVYRRFTDVSVDRIASLIIEQQSPIKNLREYNFSSPKLQYPPYSSGFNFCID